MPAENMDASGYPDARELELMANRLFSASPNSSPDTKFNPAANAGKTLNGGEPQTSLPDPHFAGTGNVPGSVAGAGISPSAANRTHDFDIKDPQTSLPDPHFENERPKAPGGRDIYTEAGLPFASELPFEAELKSIFEHISLSLPGSQFPVESSPSFSDASFYFLEGKQALPSAKDRIGIPGNPLSEHPASHFAGGSPIDVNAIRRDFPILQELVNGRPLIWLDNAATTQKPNAVIDRLSHFYKHENSNIHRAAHELAARSTDAYESARKKVQTFLNAASPNEIIFVRGSTEAINLVAQSWGDQFLTEGDEIIVSHLEHHANIVPWQLLAGKKGLKLRVIPVDDDGQIILGEYAKLLGPKTKLVSFTQVSNALGTITPAKKMVEMAHAAGAKVLVDGAQAVSHLRADVMGLNCDWYVFSGHKVFGPTGIGVLYGKEDLLNQTQPWQGGGNMIQDVTFEHTRYQDAPGRFEAGTGNIADAVGLGAAIDYVTRIGIDRITQYEHYLLLYASKLMKTVPGLRLIGTAPDKASVLSFVLDGYKTEEVGTALNQHGIAVRSGHHCAQPILRRFGLETTVRPSLAFYNTCSEIDAMVSVLQGLGRKLRRN